MTSLRYLCECQARASLEVDIVGVDEGAERSEGVAAEEVVLGPLKQRLANDSKDGSVILRYRGSSANRLRPHVRSRQEQSCRGLLESDLYMDQL